jgi:copper transport protein
VVRAARAAATTTAVAWLVALPLTITYQLGGGLGSLGSGETWAALPPVEYGVTAAVVLGTLAAVRLLGTGEPARGRAVAAGGAALLAAGAPALTGHTRAATPELLAIAADVVHLLAGSVWLGGLLALLLVLPDLAGRGALGAEVVARFSAYAAGVLVALGVTGAFLAWRIVASWSALVETGYGRLLLAKIAVVLLVVAGAAWNRTRLVPQLVAADRRRDRRSGASVVVRATGVEVGALVLALLLTGLLVDRSPEAAAEPPRAGNEYAQLGAIRVRASIAPLAVGPATVTLHLTDVEDEPTEGFEAPRARLTSTDVDLGEIVLASTAPGTYAGDVVLPAAGTWQLQISLRTSEFDNPVATVELTVP